MQLLGLVVSISGGPSLGLGFTDTLGQGFAKRGVKKFLWQAGLFEIGPKHKLTLSNKPTDGCNAGLDGSLELQARYVHQLNKHFFICMDKGVKSWGGQHFLFSVVPITGHT